MSRSNEEIAAALFGGPEAPAPTPTTAPAKPLSDADTAALLYGPADDSEPDESAPRTPDGVVLDKVFANAQRDILTAATERLGLSSEEATESAVAWGEVFREFDVGGEQAQHLAALGIGAMANAPDEATVHAWGLEARTAVGIEFGAANVGRVLADARTLISRHPGLRELLDSSGLGSHKQVVLAACAKARALRAAGRP